MVKEKYGADYGINYKTHPSWAKEVLNLTDGRGVDFIFENGGSGTIKQSIECIVPGGIISLIGFLSKAAQNDMPDVAGLVLSKGCIIRAAPVGSKQLMEELVRCVHSKKLGMPVDQVFGFGYEDIMNAFALLEAGGQVGKICIVVE